MTPKTLLDGLLDFDMMNLPKHFTCICIQYYSYRYKFFCKKLIKNINTSDQMKKKVDDQNKRSLRLRNL